MDSELKGAIDVLVKRVDAKTAELNNTKKMVNDLCREAGIDAIYTDTEMESRGSGISIRPDEYYGKSPMSAAREFLEKRKQAATLDEIRDALYRGGFDFDAQKWPENAQVRNLSIGVSKNSRIFHRLPNGMIGLTPWYPNVKVKKADDEAASAEVGVADEGTEGTEPNGTVDHGESSFIPKLSEDDMKDTATTG